MPTKCSVSDCENYYSRGVPFFDVPSPLKYKFCSEKAELSKKRRKLWLDAIGVSDTSSEILRICSKHFVTGKPARLEDSTNVDWIPTLHTVLDSAAHKIHRKKGEDNDKKRRESSRNSRPSKDIGKYPKNVDLKKFLNCKVLLDGNIRCTTFRGTNGSGLTIAQNHGYFTSDNVTLKETAINNTVLRIHLPRENLDDLRKRKSHSSGRRKRNDQKVSSFGRQIKRKSLFFENSFIHTPSRKGVDSNKTVGSSKNSISSTGRSERQMKTRNEKESKTTSIIDRFQSRHEFAKDISESARTLNRTIKKNFRDRIKIKLFPKSTTPIIRKGNRNGTISPTLDDTLKLHREILFVKNQPQWTYYLRFCPPRYPGDGTLDYSFQKLVTDVKHMKLPAPSWKIKVIIRQGKISAITFTNKSSLERCVAFSANNNRYKITIDNKSALLLGSPKHLQTSEDLEILLDIIQNIESDNPMIFYK